ncbi:MAG: DsrE/DsrF/DrsH-like family protein [Chloroflexota bacterium]|nr:DsrE/DsrF/DrsH-like family protein [Chloroflexota bacterium]
MSMDVLEISREDLIPEVEDVVGVATFVKGAADSKIQLFIFLNSTRPMPPKLKREGLRR